MYSASKMAGDMDFRVEGPWKNRARGRHGTWNTRMAKMVTFLLYILWSKRRFYSEAKETVWFTIDCEQKNNLKVLQSILYNVKIQKRFSMPPVFLFFSWNSYGSKNRILIYCRGFPQVRNKDLRRKAKDLTSRGLERWIFFLEGAINTTILFFKSDLYKYVPTFRGHQTLKR